jgi:hypothetical protein
MYVFFLANFYNCWNPTRKRGLDWKEKRQCLLNCPSQWLMRNHSPGRKTSTHFSCLFRKKMNSEILKRLAFLCQNHKYTIWDASRSWFTKILWKKGKAAIKVSCPPVTVSAPKTPSTKSLETLNFVLLSLAFNSIQLRTLTDLRRFLRPRNWVNGN